MKPNCDIDAFVSSNLRADYPPFSIGDTLRIHLRIIEGQKERTQVFTGVLIARKGRGISETIKIHREAYGCKMDRVFLINSPKIAKIEIERKGKVRRGKLYYLTRAKGKATYIKEAMKEVASTQTSEKIES